MFWGCQGADGSSVGVGRVLECGIHTSGLCSHTSLDAYLRVQRRARAIKDLVLDKERTHGQVRKVDMDWAESLQKTLEADRPSELELTVWKEQGVPSPSSAVLLACFGQNGFGRIAFSCCVLLCRVYAPGRSRNAERVFTHYTCKGLRLGITRYMTVRNAYLRIHVLRALTVQRRASTTSSADSIGSWRRSGWRRRRRTRPCWRDYGRRWFGGSSTVPGCVFSRVRTWPCIGQKGRTMARLHGSGQTHVRRFVTVAWRRRRYPRPGRSGSAATSSSRTRRWSCAR